MAIGETAKLLASLELKDLFTKNLDNASKSLGKFDKSLDSSQSRAFRAGQQIGTGIKRGTAIALGAFGALAGAAALGVSSLEKAETVSAQTAAALKSTKDASGQTAAGISALANSLESLNATFDDTTIQAGANVLLTFTNIRKQAFEPALKAALDLSTAMGQDLQSSVVQLGKALNDPVKGITALTRVGVTFDAQQKKQIKSLVEQGKTFEAQKIILAELNKEFGGSFIAQGNTTAGKVAKVKDAIDDLERAFAKALLPAVSKVADAVTSFLGRADVQKQVEELGQAIAGLFSDENLKAGAEFLGSAFDAAKSAAPVVAEAAKVTAGFVKAAVDLFKSLPAPLQGLLVGGFALNKLTGGLVTNIGGALLDLVGKSRGATPANPVFVADVTGGLGGAAGAGGGLLKSLGSLITKLGGLALIGGGAAAIGAGASMGGPAGAGVAAGGAAAAIGGGALLAGPLGAIAASIGAVALTLKDVRDQSASQGQGIADSIRNELSGGAKITDLRKSLDAVNQGINDIQANPLNVLVAGDALDQLRAQKDLLEKQIAAQDATAANVANAGAILDRGGKATIAAISDLSGKQRDDANFIADTLRAISARQNAAIETLRKSNDPKAVLAALHDIEEITIKAGHGNLQTAKAEAAAIRRQLQHVHDPTLRAALVKTLHDVEGKLPGRAFAQRELAKADAVLHANLSNGEKLRRLQTIEDAIGKHHLPGAARAIREKIEALKQSQAAKLAAVAQAVRDKKAQVVIQNQIDAVAKIDSKVLAREVRRVSRIYAIPV